VPLALIGGQTGGGGYSFTGNLQCSQAHRPLRFAAVLAEEARPIVRTLRTAAEPSCRWSRRRRSSAPGHRRHPGLAVRA
ncbi:unnamed protein product, partial [Effrenium voratum]